MTPSTATPPGLTVRQLLISTSLIAVGFGALGLENLPVALLLFGLSAGCYGVATGIFACSASLDSPCRELFFLVGLPVYACCIICGAIACLIVAVIVIQLVAAKLDR